MDFPSQDTNCNCGVYIKFDVKSRTILVDRRPAFIDPNKINILILSIRGNLKKSNFIYAKIRAVTNRKNY